MTEDPLDADASREQAGVELRFFIGRWQGRTHFLRGVGEICRAAGVEWDWTTGWEFPFRGVVITLRGSSDAIDQARRDINVWAVSFRSPPVSGSGS